MSVFQQRARKKRQKGHEVDTVYIQNLDLTISIRVAKSEPHSGVERKIYFFAEHAGETFQGDTAEKVKTAVTKAAEATAVIDWKPVIEIVMHSSHSWDEHRDVEYVGFEMTKFEIAALSTGRVIRRKWSGERDLTIQDDHARYGGKERIRISYTAVTWERLRAIQERITVIRRELEEMLRRPDLPAVLAQAVPLLGLPEPEIKKRKPREL